MMSMMARRSNPCSARSRLHSSHSLATEPTIRRASTAPSLSAILESDADQHSYDLAYYWYDYPDTTFWLWPLLDPVL